MHLIRYLRDFISKAKQSFKRRSSQFSQRMEHLKVKQTLEMHIIYLVTLQDVYTNSATNVSGLEIIFEGYK